MNPCEICGDRILHYPGICDPCKEQRRRTAETQWMPAYEFVTEARDKGNKSTFNAKGNTDHTAAGRPATDKQIGVHPTPRNKDRSRPPASTHQRIRSAKPNQRPPRPPSPHPASTKPPHPTTASTEHDRKETATPPTPRRRTAPQQLRAPRHTMLAHHTNQRTTIPNRPRLPHPRLDRRPHLLRQSSTTNHRPPGHHRHVTPPTHAWTCYRTTVDPATVTQPAPPKHTQELETHQIPG